MFKLVSFLFLATVSFNSFAQQDEKSGKFVEVPLDHLFVISEGFDTNDPVQVMALTTLKNACYTRLGRPQVQIDTEKQEVRLVQTAFKRNDGVCQNEEQLPPDLKIPHSYEKEIDFDEISIPGKYKVIYQTKNGLEAKELGIAQAPVADVDSLRYAMVTNAFADVEGAKHSKEFEVRITGYLNSSCAELKEDSKIQKVGDVYVALLEVGVSDDICLPTTKPFYKIFKVETPPEGTYLLHARSLGGQSKNHVFRVKK